MMNQQISKKQLTMALERAKRRINKPGNKRSESDFSERHQKKLTNQALMASSCQTPFTRFRADMLEFSIFPP
jgi:predicted ABC-type ATPase